MSICDVPVIAEVCNLGGDVAGVMVAAPFEWLASAVGHAAAMMFENVWAVFDTTTLVDLTPEQYIAVYNIVFGIAIVVMLVFSFLQLGTGLIRRDADALQHPVPGLAKSVLGSFLVVTSTATLLEIVDQLCIGIVEPTGTTMEQMGDRIAALALGLTAITFATPGGRGDHRSHPGRDGGPRRGDGVGHPADPQDAAAGRDRHRAAGVLRSVLGCRAA